MKSVLHVASIAPGGSYGNEQFLKAFLDNGFTTYHCFDFQLETFEYGHEVMRQKLVRMAENVRPDLIFLHVQNSEALDLDTVKKLSEKAFTVLYTFDCRTKEKTEWLYQFTPYIGLVCFSNQEDVNEAKERWNNNVMVLQSSCDMDLYKPTHGIPTKGIYFIGGNYVGTNLNFPLAQERVDMVEFLEKTYGSEFKALGMGWHHGTILKAKDEVKVYHSCDIAISHNNFDRELYTSDRLWRIMASGAFCITKYFKGIETMFERGIHLDWWSDFDELKDKIDYYLAWPEKRDEAALAGMWHVRTFHRWTDRIEEMMKKVFSLKPVDTPCKDAHRVKGQLPETEEFDNTVCDCGMLKFTWEECGCENKIWQIRANQNI